MADNHQSANRQDQSHPIASWCHQPTPEQIYIAAKTYVASGLSLIPIRADATKMPAFELFPRVWCEESRKYRRPWSAFKERRPTPAELQEWYEEGYLLREYGIAIIGGAVSGGLEIIDCDSWDVAMDWLARVMHVRPDLIDKLVRVRTPRPGMHAYYRCSEIGGNQKLARIPDRDHNGKKPKTIIETKGEAGYCLAPPSPAGCHKSGKCYQLIVGNDLANITTISPEERAVLHKCARSLDTWQPPRRPPYASRARPQTVNRAPRPGDDFNERAEWGDILIPHGWTWAGTGGDGADHWCRPGKDRGSSATTNHEGLDLLYVFSSNADPFEEETGYTKFHAFALLNFRGDFNAAARALAAQGYGRHSRYSDIDDNPFARYGVYVPRSRRPKT